MEMSPGDHLAEDRALLLLLVLLLLGLQPPFVESPLGVNKVVGVELGHTLSSELSSHPVRLLVFVFPFGVGVLPLPAVLLEELLQLIADRLHTLPRILQLILEPLVQPLQLLQLLLQLLVLLRARAGRRQVADLPCQVVRFALQVRELPQLLVPRSPGRVGLLDELREHALALGDGGLERGDLGFQGAQLAALVESFILPLPVVGVLLRSGELFHGLPDLRGPLVEELLDQLRHARPEGGLVDGLVFGDLTVRVWPDVRRGLLEFLADDLESGLTTLDLLGFAAQLHLHLAVPLAVVLKRRLEALHNLQQPFVQISASARELVFEVPSVLVGGLVIKLLCNHQDIDLGACLLGRQFFLLLLPDAGHHGLGRATGRLGLDLLLRLRAVRAHHLLHDVVPTRTTALLDPLAQLLDVDVEDAGVALDGQVDALQRPIVEVALRPVEVDGAHLRRLAVGIRPVRLPRVQVQYRRESGQVVTQRPEHALIAETVVRQAVIPRLPANVALRHRLAQQVDEVGADQEAGPRPHLRRPVSGVAEHIPAAYVAALGIDERDLDMVKTVLKAIGGLLRRLLLPLPVLAANTHGRGVCSDRSARPRRAVPAAAAPTMGPGCGNPYS
mmetsp:Transcript_69486/g.225842  ORF Transcript_69486/g.225842 Transcript_69486/m.225842 type:complete len:615 (+) Transcript_69486:1515-3359(+)